MGVEQLEQSSADRSIDQKPVRGGRVRSGLNPLDAELKFLQSVGQTSRIAHYHRAAPVGAVFTPARNRHVNQHRGRMRQSFLKP